MDDRVSGYSGSFTEQAGPQTEKRSPRILPRIYIKPLFNFTYSVYNSNMPYCHRCGEHRISVPAGNDRPGQRAVQILNVILL